MESYGYTGTNGLTRIFLSAIFIVAAWYLGFSSYLPDQGIGLTQQKFMALITLSLSLSPLFYKTRGERNPFSAETKKEVLDKQDHRCGICGKDLSRFNIDFEHINGNRSDSRQSNCRALCTPCHRRRHSDMVAKSWRLSVTVSSFHFLKQAT